MASTNSLPYIGSKISLISRALIRYDGILLNINTNEQTVGLGNVRCYGTEDRVMGADAILPSSDIYDYVVFQGKNIKDITVSELAGPDDPAIVAINPPPSAQQTGVPNQTAGGLSVNDQPMMHHYMGPGQGTGRVKEPPSNSFLMGQGVMPQVMSSTPQVDHYGGGHAGNAYNQNANMGRPPVDYNGRMGRNNKGQGYSFMAPQYMGSMYNMPYNKRSSGYGNYRSGRSSTGVIGELTPQPNQSLKSRVAKAFNFEEANLKFNKTATNSQDELPNEEEEETSENKPILPTTKGVYDKKSSFFDNISCETLDRQSGNTIKMDRIKQRQLDMETFGASAKQTRPGRVGDARMSCRRVNGVMGGYSRRGLGGGPGVNSALAQHGLIGYQHVGPAISGYNPGQPRY